MSESTTFRTGHEQDFASIQEVVCSDAEQGANMRQSAIDAGRLSLVNMAGLDGRQWVGVIQADQAPAPSERPLPPTLEMED